jgi:hypothetical protein
MRFGHWSTMNEAQTSVFYGRAYKGNYILALVWEMDGLK